MKTSTLRLNVKMPCPNLSSVSHSLPISPIIPLHGRPLTKAYPPMAGGTYPPQQMPPPGGAPPFRPPFPPSNSNGYPPQGMPPPNQMPPPQFQPQQFGGASFPPLNQGPPPQQGPPPSGFTAASTPSAGNPGIHPDRMRMMGNGM